MIAFVLLILSCAVLIGGYLLRRVDWQVIEEENRRYYTEEGYHIYYDRKICVALKKRDKRKR